MLGTATFHGAHVGDNGHASNTHGVDSTVGEQFDADPDLGERVLVITPLPQVTLHWVLTAAEYVHGVVGAADGSGRGASVPVVPDGCTGQASNCTLTGGDVSGIKCVPGVHLQHHAGDVVQS